MTDPVPINFRGKCVGTADVDKDGNIKGEISNTDELTEEERAALCGGAFDRILIIKGWDIPSYPVLEDPVLYRINEENN